MKSFNHFLFAIFLTVSALSGCSKDNGGDMNPPATDLSAGETANCYIVPSAGSYSFKTVRGNTSKSVGDVATADVLWESFGTDVTPDVGDIVKSVEYKDGYVTFTTADPLNNGNALIAVKDAEGNILWSWHIWVCKDYTPTKENQHVYSNKAGIMMDRNLGATSATPGDIHALGLLYQWGRKDPFLNVGGFPAKTGNDAIGEDDDLYGLDATDNSCIQAASTLDWPQAVKTDASTGTMDYAVQHPTIFIAGGNDREDWTTASTTRWNTPKKSDYDPCPAGWRVPSGDVNEKTYALWQIAFDTQYWKTPSNFDKTNLGMDFARTDRKLGKYDSIWYPASGCRDAQTGGLLYVGTVGPCWTACQAGENKSYTFDHRKSGEVYTQQDLGNAWGASVRCVAE